MIRTERTIRTRVFHSVGSASGELLKTSDFISIHTPLTPETRHMISRER